MKIREKHKVKQRRKLVIYRTKGKLDYFEYYYDGIWLNEKKCEAWLAKHPNYQCGTVQVITTGPQARAQAFFGRERVHRMDVAEIIALCESAKQAAKDNKPEVLREDDSYTYNKPVVEEWIRIAKENNWDLNESIKPLCEKLSLAPVVVAPALQRYGYIEKKQPTEKVYKHSKEDVQKWWDLKNSENLTITQLAEKVGVHFLQVGRAFTQYGFVPKKEKKPRKEKREKKAKLTKRRKK